MFSMHWVIRSDERLNVQIHQIGLTHVIEKAKIAIHVFYVILHGLIKVYKNPIHGLRYICR